MEDLIEEKVEKYLGEQREGERERERERERRRERERERERRNFRVTLISYTTFLNLLRMM